MVYIGYFEAPLVLGRCHCRIRVPPHWLDIGKHITPSYLDLFQEYGMANYQCSTGTLCESNIHQWNIFVYFCLYSWTLQIKVKTNVYLSHTFSTFPPTRSWTFLQIFYSANSLFRKGIIHAIDFFAFLPCKGYWAVSLKVLRRAQKNLPLLIGK